ncbi:DUF2989 domain-containing protein [Vibrio porteresiae]|uniref:DUF2989 domain-containing protein n=1 Tax=Vibrio porteresiae DSM 19223 TaxID=1123496 RepID=A0ABZ0QCI1_9VIBR|nr:DUF2989 domain-containing protein [Vibrio porteresiae]WPC73233.1 DUF2989 domain-containing protein [Vibrio porteresiae DSM 19223]
MNSIKFAALVLVTASMSGCFENRNNTDKLCAENPNLRCERLNISDGQCRVARTDLIWHRFEVLKNDTVDNKISEFHYLAKYKKCMELASQIRAIDQTELKQIRFQAMQNAAEDQHDLIEAIRQSKTPQAYYFLWSQIGDKSAQREFLQMEGKPQLESTEMQYALATFYTQRDHKKTIILLNHALELAPDDNVNIDIFKSLASTHQLLNQREYAYIWAKVSQHYGVQIASAKDLQLLYGFSDDEYGELDKIADNVVAALKVGQYHASMIKNQLAALATPDPAPNE